MQHLKDLSDYLEIQGTVEQGNTMFLHTMPPEVNKAVMLRVPLGGTSIDHELRGYFKTSYQLIVRHTQVQPGFDLANSLLKKLFFSEKQLNNIYVKFSRPKHQPVMYRRSESGNFEFSVNFEICFTDTKFIF
jgi:hypothetical protein